MKLFKGSELRNLQEIYTALDRSQAVIEFEPSGTILKANDNFLSALGYSLDEIQGRHHAMFVDPDYARTEEYKAFWKGLAAGDFRSGLFKRRTKEGKDIWIEATYNPIFDKKGKVYKVIKFASDTTKRVLEAADLKSQVEAVSKVSAVITFDLNGNILDANQNFLNAMGYAIEEIRGRHHSMFVDPEYAKSAEYRDFWAHLNTGAFASGQYKRFAKGQREVWIEASYNAILTPDGKPYKVIKYATDITSHVQLLKNLENILSVNFGEIDGAVNKSEEQTNSAVGAAEETTVNVQALAASTEELAASISEISSTMSRSREATEGATASTEAANQATERLSGATNAMTGIVKLIQDIAGEINLLALNATIESARAGEAGRGFAVVANEVKNLAEQAAKATEQISREIDGIQSISGEVVDSLGTISEAFQTVKDQVSTAAAAVEEQSVVTTGMSKSMHEAATSVGVISNSVGNINGAIAEINSAVTKTRDAAAVLTR